MDSSICNLSCFASIGEMLAATDYILLVGVVLLSVVNAVVSGAEVAFFSLAEEQEDELRAGEDRISLRVCKLLDISDELSGTIVVAFNFFNIVITALLVYLLSTSVSLFSGLWEPWLGLLLIFVYLYLFIEVLPKLYALQRPLRFARFSSRLMSVVAWLFAPLSVLMTKTTTIFNSESMGMKYDLSLEDISTALKLTANSDSHEQDILEDIIRFRDKIVDDVLIARSEMVALDIDTSFSEVIESIIAAGFSRIPVYHNHPDDIKGILYVKDLLPHLEKSDNFRWQSLIRPAYFVPGAKRIDDLLEEFRANKNHMAIVVDEYGGTSGIITLEDILEEIVGDISDEYDEDESPDYVKQADGSYLFEGRVSLVDFMEIVGIEDDVLMVIGEGVDTLAGLLLELKGDFPKPMEVIEYGEHRFVAEELDDRRIIKIKYVPPHRTVIVDEGGVEAG